MKLRFSGWLGAILVAATVLVAVISLVWTPYDPTLAHPDVSLAGPSAEHLLGTDRFGRDTASRLMAGAQITVFVGLVAGGNAPGGGPRQREQDASLRGHSRHRAARLGLQRCPVHARPLRQRGPRVGGLDHRHRHDRLRSELPHLA